MRCPFHVHDENFSLPLCADAEEEVVPAANYSALQAQPCSNLAGPHYYPLNAPGDICDAALSRSSSG